MHSSQIYDFHPINGIKIRTIVALKNLLGQTDHFLDCDENSIANSFKKIIYYVKVHN